MASLKDKITSEAQLRTTLENEFREYSRVARQLQMDLSVPPDWWAIREKARLYYGIYQTTDGLDVLNSHVPWAFCHISTEEPTMVAYTPDKASGESDRQLRLSIGRLAAKLLPFAKDEYTADIVSKHNADLSNEVFFAEGDELIEIYRNGAVSSCMSGKTFANTGGHYPAEVYKAEGIKLAYLRDKHGAVNARCLVYETAKEKRRIRAYGDPVLEKRLIRLGYSVGDWQGVKFNTVKLGDGTYLVPYLGAMGGACREAGSSVMVLGGVLQGVPKNLLQSLPSSWKSGRVKVPGTAGYIELIPVDAAEFSYTCAITGEYVSVVDHPSEEIYFDNKVYKVKRSEVENWETVRVMHDGEACRTKVPAEFAESNAFFNYGSFLYEDTPETREKLGFQMLSSKFYGTEARWANNCRSVTDLETGETEWVLEHDRLQLLRKSEEGSTKHVYIHKSQLPKKAVKLHGDAKYAEKGVEIFRTVSGRKVHPLMHSHEISKNWKGEYDFNRNLPITTMILGVTIRHSRADALFLRSPEYRAIRVEEIFNQWKSVSLAHAGRELLISAGYSRWGELQTRYWSVIGKNVSHAEFLDLSLSDLEAVVNNGIKYTENFDVKHAKKLFNREISEMQAVEAPAYLVQETEEAEVA